MNELELDEYTSRGVYPHSQVVTCVSKAKVYCRSNDNYCLDKSDVVLGWYSSGQSLHHMQFWYPDVPPARGSRLLGHHQYKKVSFRIKVIFSST